jgi:hypothetical protein
MASSPATNGKPTPQKLIHSVWVQAAIAIAVVEAILIVAGVIPRWVSVVIAAAVIAAYFLKGRAVQNPTVRQGAWAAALSQTAVLFVPIIGWILSAALIAILAVIAAILLVVLIVDR